MKFVKRLNLDSQFPKDGTLAVEVDGRIVTDSTASLQVPAGNTSQRVQTYQNGMLRYNTDLNEFEAYVNGTWEILRTRRQANISFQNLGTGDYVSTVFGPLSYRQNPNKPENILIFVENVYQIPTVNYTLVNDPVTIKNTVGVTNPGVVDILVADQTDIHPGQEVTGDPGIPAGATVVSLGTQTSTVKISSSVLMAITAGTPLSFAFSTGTYVTFTSAPPMKPVYALNGFDGYYPPFPG